jgi:hypothetical protein
MSLYEACYSNHNTLKKIEIYVLVIFLSIFGYCSLGILQNLFRGMKFSIRVIPHYPFWFRLLKRIRKSEVKKEEIEI